MLSAFRKGGKCVGRKTGYFLLLLLIFFWGGGKYLQSVEAEEAVVSR